MINVDKEKLDKLAEKVNGSQKVFREQREYSAEEKAAALAIAEISPNLSVAARTAGIPKETMYYWWKDPLLREQLQSLKDEYKKDLASGAEELLWMIQTKLPGAIEAAEGNLHDLVGAHRLLVNDMQLLRGRATGIGQQLESPQARDARIVRELIDELVAEEGLTEQEARLEIARVIPKLSIHVEANEVKDAATPE